MSRSFFRSTNIEQNNPLLPLQHLPPHTASSTRSQSPAISTSPPPSFYRANNAAPSSSHSHSPGPGAARRHPSRSIQFAPPPSIMASAMLTPPRSNTQTSHPAPPTHRAATADPLLILERRSRALQHELQILLDAQSAGLVQGFGGGGDAESEAGSSTPTMSVRSSEGRQGVVPVRQPKRKVLGLRGARRGLGRDMGALIAVKAEEGAILDGEIQRREEVLGRVGGWEKQIEGARTKLQGYSDGEDTGEDSEVRDLRGEEKAVENEIREMEERLAQMRARKKWLGERIREGENRREARLSSYRGALREVEGEVREFLKAPPVQVSVVMGDDRGFTGLPVHRRTLGMAREWWTKEASQLEMRRKEVEQEKTALEDGAKMWADSVEIVTEFEDGLRQQMSSADPQSPEGLRIQISKMREVISRLSGSFTVAEEKGWNLLICAVGAELEAFKEGEGILKGALEIVASQESQKDSEAEAEVEREDSFHSTDDGLNTLAELNGALKIEDSEGGESEDDGPNLAELLVDRNGDD